MNKIVKIAHVTILPVFFLVGPWTTHAGNSGEEFDVVIYGSSPAAISTAIQDGRMGKRVVIVSPETRIGGLTTGGLGQTDIGNKKAFGGIALEFYRDIARYYADESHWTREKRDGLVIHRGKRMDRSAGKVKVRGEGEQRRIESFVTEDGTEYCGKMFVDATYEGDLMAAAGVSYVVGREANEVYGAIIPKRGECVNLFVPVCLSASHIAFGSIRMEPVFFALGQVAGTAAAQAIDAGCAIQDLPFAPLSARLDADGMVRSLPKNF